MTATPEHPFYSFDKVLSYNAVINMVSGARGLGKTFGAKEKAVTKALRNFERGETIDMFVYLRRYKNEIVASKPTFFADNHDLWPDYDFRVHGNVAQFAPANTRDEKKREWCDMGYFVALSTAQSLKGVSYHTVKTIIFDEFILEKGAVHYLRGEAAMFLNFYNTVDRWKDKTRVYMLSNAVSIDNPYFTEWNIGVDATKEFTKYGIGEDGRPFIIVHFPEASAFQTSVFKTRFGQFIKDSEYADYAVSNEFKDNNSRLLATKDASFRLQFNLETRKGTFSVWYSDVHQRYMALAKLPPNTKTFTLEPERMDSGKILLPMNDPLLGMLRTAWRKDALYFDDARTRNSLMDAFRN